MNLILSLGFGTSRLFDWPSPPIPDRDGVPCNDESALLSVARRFVDCLIRLINPVCVLPEFEAARNRLKIMI